MIVQAQEFAGHIEILMGHGPGNREGGHRVVPSDIHGVPLLLQLHQVPGVLRRAAVGHAPDCDALDAAEVHQQLEGGGVAQESTVMMNLVGKPPLKAAAADRVRNSLSVIRDTVMM